MFAFQACYQKILIKLKIQLIMVIIRIKYCEKQSRIFYKIEENILDNSKYSRTF